MPISQLPRSGIPTKSSFFNVLILYFPGISSMAGQLVAICSKMIPKAYISADEVDWRNLILIELMSIEEE